MGPVPFGVAVPNSVLLRRLVLDAADCRSALTNSEKNSAADR